MNKIIRLVRVQLWAVLSDTLSIGKNRNKKPKMLIAGVLFFYFLMSFVVLVYSFLIGAGLKMFNSLDLLPALVMAATCFVVLFTTIFKVKGTIFGFRDYDMVMSLPVSTGAIAISRLIVLYTLNILFVIIMMVPMIISYGFLANPGPLFYLMGIITIFIVPLVPIIVATLIGTLIAFIASKFKHSNLVNLIVSLIFFTAIIASSFMIKGDGQELLNISKTLTSRINQIYPLAPFYAKALTHSDIYSFIVFVGVSLGAFMIYTYLFHKVFKRINTLMFTGGVKSNYKMGELKTSSPIKSLYMKEIKRYFSSTLYVMNTGFGIVLLTLGSIAMIFVDINKIFQTAETSGAIADYIPIYVVFCIVMSCTTMVSISLEGKSFWILKSMPISPKTVFQSKLLLNFTIISPALIDALIIGVVFKMDFVQLLSMIFVTVACACFISLYGMFINLLLPNFNWTAEVTVIKQSAATMITIFSGMGYAAILFIFIAIIPSAALAYLSYGLFTTIVAAVLYKVIMSYGCKRYYKL